jgi:hypothetical protein
MDCSSTRKTIGGAIRWSEKTSPFACFAAMDGLNRATLTKYQQGPTLRRLAQEGVFFRMPSQQVQGSQATLPEQLDAETLSKLDEALQNWDNEGSELRKRFEEAETRWAKLIDPLVQAIRESEQLTKEDLAIRINTRE